MCLPEWSHYALLQLPASVVWQNFCNLAKSDSSTFQPSFASSPAVAADFFRRNGARHRSLHKNPQSVIPESKHKNPENPTKPDEINKTLCTKFAFFLLTTHALMALALMGLPSHTPAASSFLTALVVVYTPIMLGSAFTAHAHKHTPLNSAQQQYVFCFFPTNPPQTDDDWVVAEIARTAFVITLHSSCCPHTPTLTQR